MVWKRSPVIVVALIAHHTPALTPCNGTSWINMGNLLWEFTYPISESRGLFLHDALHEDTSSQNAVLLYEVSLSLWPTVILHGYRYHMSSACSRTVLEWNVLHENFQCICNCCPNLRNTSAATIARGSRELCIASSNWITTLPDKLRTIEQVREIVQANREEGINDSYQIKWWLYIAHWMQQWQYKNCPFG
jgi:hypothetical protein